MNKKLNYSDVALIPRFSSLKTREEASVRAPLGCINGEIRYFKVPVIPSNMRCVINEEKSEFFSQNDYMYVMHRFDFDNLEFVRIANVKKWNNISISVGVKKQDYELIEKIGVLGFRVDYITIDIAHGHSQLMKDMIYFIKNKLPNTFIIAGNVCTPEGYDDLVEWGAGALKVGIGPGAACTTKLKTGFTYPMYSCISEIVEYSKYYHESFLIADGGIQHNGDIAKAIHAGADWVMCGKMFSECVDSPAPIDNKGFKMYYGSASAHNKKHKNNIEGTLISVESNHMNYAEKLSEIQQDLQSSVSYAGGNCLYDIRNAKHVIVN